MYKKAGYCGALLLLGYLSERDIKFKKIPMAPLLISGILGTVYAQAGNEMNVENFIWRMLPGMIFLLLSVLTGEKIGYGDGAVVLVLGMWTNGRFCMLVSCTAVLLSGVYAVWLLIKKKKELIPFVPFLLAAMEVMLIYE